VADLRKLSESQARRCENACTPRCRCRCGGALHGAGRLTADAPRELFEQLPADDPHKIRERKPGAKPARRRRPLREQFGLPLGSNG